MMNGVRKTETERVVCTVYTRNKVTESYATHALVIVTVQHTVDKILMEVSILYFR